MIAHVRKTSRHLAALATGGTAVFAASIGMFALSRPEVAATPNLGLVADSTPTLRGAMVGHEPALPVEKPEWVEVSMRVPVDSKGRPYDQLYPSLHEWVHPITGADEHLPSNPARHFGAERKGIDRPDCGRGHCGIDLHGPRGRALVSVLDGVVVRIERRFDGGDGMSGRFVRIQHEDGYFTTYMHMDTVDPKLAVGDRVRQGQFIGTLGSTGVQANAPHLHFSLEVPLRYKAFRGDLPMSDSRYINAAAFLNTAKIIPEPERRPLKPST